MTIVDFDDLVDPQTLALHYFGLEPSAYILRTIEIEEKKSKCLLNSPLLLFSSSFSLFLYYFFLTSVFCRDDNQI